MMDAASLIGMQTFCDRTEVFVTILVWIYLLLFLHIYIYVYIYIYTGINIYLPFPFCLCPLFFMFRFVCIFPFFSDRRAESPGACCLQFWKKQTMQTKPRHYEWNVNGEWFARAKMGGTERLARHNVAQWFGAWLWKRARKKGPRVVAEN